MTQQLTKTVRRKHTTFKKLPITLRRKYLKNVHVPDTQDEYKEDLQEVFPQRKQPKLFRFTGCSAKENGGCGKKNDRSKTHTKTNIRIYKH
jgi:hypothetical protein